eukprot:4649898-Amphidinium_carterae.1
MAMLRTLERMETEKGIVCAEAARLGCGHRSCKGLPGLIDKAWRKKANAMRRRAAGSGDGSTARVCACARARARAV